MVVQRFAETASYKPIDILLGLFSVAAESTRKVSKCKFLPPPSHNVGWHWRIRCSWRRAVRSSSLAGNFLLLAFEIDQYCSNYLCCFLFLESTTQLLVLTFYIILLPWTNQFILLAFQLVFRACALIYCDVPVCCPILFQLHSIHYSFFQVLWHLKHDPESSISEA